MAKNQALYNMIRQGLLQRGARALIADLAAAQVMHETGHGTSKVQKDLNNYSGIKYVKQAGATQGTKSPEGNYYAKYANMGAWIDDYIRILKLNRSGQGNAWSAKSLADYATKLKLNGYYTDTLENYKKALAAMLKMYVPAPPAAKDPFAPKTKIQRLQDTGEQRRQAMDQRPGITQERPLPAGKKPWSLQKWFEDLSSLNKALVIGAGGFLISRVIR